MTRRARQRPSRISRAHLDDRSLRAAARCRPTRSSRARARAPRGPSRRGAPRRRASSTTASRERGRVVRRHERRRLRRRDGRVAGDVGGDGRRRARERLGEHEPEALAAERRRDGELRALRARASAPRSVTIPSTSMPASSKRMRACRSRYCSGSVPISRSRAPVAAWIARPRAQQHRQALARVVAPDEDDGVVAVGRVGVVGDDDAVRDHPVVAAAASATPTRPPSARRRSARRCGPSGSPRNAAQDRIQPRSPCA